MREPDKEITTYSSRCGIHAKVIPRKRFRRMYFGGRAAWSVGVKKAEPRTPLMYSERRRITGFDFPTKPKKRNR